MARSTSPPAFLFYPRDLLSSTAVALMTPEARGGYLMLLAHAWLQERPGWLPADDASLAALSGLNGRWEACKPMIERAFTVKEGYWVQCRMVAEREKRTSFQRLQQQRANAGWRKRKENQALSGINPAMPERCLSFAFASSSSKNKESTPPAQSLRAAKPRSGRIPAQGSPSLPTNTGESWQPTQEELDAWAQAYVGLDVIGTLREAAAWLIANPTRRKTFNGMSRFVNGWLAREQNRL